MQRFRRTTKKGSRGQRVVSPFDKKVFQGPCMWSGHSSEKVSRALLLPLRDCDTGISRPTLQMLPFGISVFRRKNFEVIKNSNG